MSSRLQDGFNLRISEGNDEIEHSRFGDFDVFNSRSREGATRLLCRKDSMTIVSIHAPVRERRCYTQKDTMI